MVAVAAVWVAQLSMAAMVAAVSTYPAVEEEVAACSPAVEPVSVPEVVMEDYKMMPSAAAVVVYFVGAYVFSSQRRW